MIFLKNNELFTQRSKQLCKIHNDKKNDERRVPLSIFKSHNFVKSYHPLKQKKIKLHRLKFVHESYLYAEVLEKTEKIKKKGDKKFSITMQTKTDIRTSWSTEHDIIEWLLSIGVQIKKTSTKKYILKNRICFLNNVLVFANKKRIEIGLEPFYLSGLTEI